MRQYTFATHWAGVGRAFLKAKHCLGWPALFLPAFFFLPASCKRGCPFLSRYITGLLLHLGSQGVVRENPSPPPFSLVDLSLFYSGIQP